MKKRIALLLVTAFVAVVLGGCGDSEAERKKKEEAELNKTLDKLYKTDKPTEKLDLKQ